MEAGKGARTIKPGASGGPSRSSEVDLQIIGKPRLGNGGSHAVPDAHPDADGFPIPVMRGEKVASLFPRDGSESGPNRREEVS